jgi:hypothetical protein
MSRDKQKTRGWGGCRILWKDNLDPYIEKFSDGSERICVILIHLPKKPICIIAAYFVTIKRCIHVANEDNITIIKLLHNFSNFIQILLYKS